MHIFSPAHYNRTNLTHAGIKTACALFILAFCIFVILTGGVSLMTTSPTQAVRANDFTHSIGVNTHIDFTWTAYGNIQNVENALNYIGVKNVRDSVNNPADIGANGWWQQVANATGVKFDAFIGSGSPAMMQTGLQYIQQIAPQNILISVEGGNEEDNTYAAGLGNTMAITALFQQQVYAVGQTWGLPVINMSFGTGWATDPLHGDYDNVGDISAYSNYANGHIYFGTGNPPSYNITWVNSLAQISSNHPVIATEMGWYTTGSTTDATSVSETVQAKYMLDGLMDAYKAGDVKTYLYELLDQHTGDGYSEDNFGLFHSDGTPKLAATALHNLTTLLADTGSTSASFAPGALSYSLSGLQSTDNSLLMEKSDGSYWLSIWDETRLSGPGTPTDIVVPNHTITLTLDSPASSVMVFDPLTGISAVQTLSNAQTVQLSLPDHPILVEIIPSGSTLPPDSHDMTLTLPDSLSATANGAAQIAAFIHDAWAADHPGTMALNLTVTNGTLTMMGANGRPVVGSGTSEMHINGTLSQLNADLATLTYHAANVTGPQTFTMDVWNQGGFEVTDTTPIDVTSSSNDLSVITPDMLVSMQGSTVQVSGVSILDEWAANHTGTMALNVTVNNGTVTMLNANGQAVAGSGTNAIHLNGTFSELNAELATLSYHAANGAHTGAIDVNVWNQAGINVTETINFNTLLGGNVQGTAGNDILSGNMGGTLTGSTGADTMYFTQANTGMGRAMAHIADFNQAQGDKIDLHGFGLTAADFNNTGVLTGNHSFTFVEAVDAHNHPYTQIQIDSNGDHISDHEIRIDNVHIDLHASDFMFA
jgi:serralysin